MGAIVGISQRLGGARVVTTTSHSKEVQLPLRQKEVAPRTPWPSMPFSRAMACSAIIDRGGFWKIFHRHSPKPQLELQVSSPRCAATWDTSCSVAPLNKCGHAIPKDHVSTQHGVCLQISHAAHTAKEGLFVKIATTQPT